MKYVFLSLFIFCFSKVASAEEVHVNFQDLKKMIESRNEKVQATQREAQAAKGREGYQSRSFLPKIEAHAAQERFKTGSQEAHTQPDYGAEANVNIYNGGRDSLREKTLQSRAERKQLEVKISAAEELGKAREIYWNIVASKNSIQLLKEAIEINSGNLRAAQRRIKSGVATESDRLEFEMKAVDLQREVTRQKLGIRSESRDLLVLLGYRPEDSLTTETELIHGGEWESEIKHTHQDHDFLVRPAELLAQETASTASEFANGWRPRLEAYASWNQYNQREEDSSINKERQETVLGLRLKMNIFDGLSSQNESSALRQEALAAQLLVQYRRKTNEAHVEKEFEELQFLHEQVHQAEENIKNALKYYKLTQSEYVRGVKNSPDVLGASEKLFNMKLKRLEIIKDFQVARAHVLTKIGK